MNRLLQAIADGDITALSSAPGLGKKGAQKIVLELKGSIDVSQLNEDDVKFITDFYKYAFVSIVLDWIEKQMKEDPKIIVQKISNLVVNAGTPLSL